MTEVVIYAMTSPDGEVYVGQTKRPKEREREHRRSKPEWIWSILTITDFDNANAEEADAMELMRSRGFTVVSRRGGSSRGASWSDDRRIAIGKKGGSAKKPMSELELKARSVASVNGGYATARLRFMCEECGRVTTPGGLSRHQHWTGHSGRVKVTE